MNPRFCGFFVFRFVKLKIGDDKFQGSTNFKKFEKTYWRKREEGRKGGREGGRQEISPDRWPSSHQSKGLPSTFPHWASQKPSQNQTKPNQAGLLLLLLPLLLLMILNQQTKSSLLTYCFALTNKTNKQTNQKQTNQPTNPSSTPHSKQTKKPTTNKNKTKAKQRVCSRFKPQKQKTPPSPLTNPYQKKTKQNKTKQNNKI